MNYLKSKKLWEKILAILILSLISYSLIALYGDISGIKSKLGGLNYLLIPYVVSFTILGLSIRFLRWQYYLKKLEIKIGRLESLKIFLIGFSMALSPGRIGEGIKSYFLKQNHDIDLFKSLNIVFAERATDIIGLGIIGILSYSYIFSSSLLLVITLFIVILGLYIGFNKLEDILSFTNRRNIPLIGEKVAKVSESWEECKVIFEPRNQIKPLSYSILSWSFNIFSLHIIVNNLSTLGLSKSSLAFTSSTLAGAISMFPGGLGVVEGGMTAMLQLFGLEKSTAVLSSLTLRIFSFWLSFIIGLFVLGYYLYTKREHE